MKSVAHPSGIPILFDAKWHRYKMGGVSLRSVSKVLDGFFPFDEKRVLALVARKTGESEEVIKAKWNRQALLGKNVHEYIENKLLQRPRPTFCLLLDKLKEKPDLAGVKDIIHGEEPLYLPVAEKAVEHLQQHYDVLAVEQVIASPSLGIAGTIDLLARNKKNGRILIGDWKTSGSVSSNFRFGSFETGSMGCLRHLPNSKMYRYALQIAIYGEILRRERYFELGYFDKELKEAVAKTALASSSTSAPPLPTETVKIISGRGGRKKKTKAAGSGSGTTSSEEHLHHTEAGVAAENPAVTSSSVIIPREMEYGLVYLCKSETGGVESEFLGVSESTILPKDRPELTFHHLLKQVLEGVS